MPSEETAKATRIPGYAIKGDLGVGAFCIIHRATSERLGRDVALKVLKPSIPRGSPFAAQLAHEGRILAGLCHPNVVLLLDASLNDRDPHLVLEHVDGPSLAALLARRPRLVPEVALAVGAALARALSHAHERGVVHRDVKPGNVVLASQGDIKLVDFGIARRDGDPEADGVRWEPHAAMGTPAYASPEQILGEPADARSDLFSLGVVLYECLSGRHPFEAQSAEDRRAAYRVRRAVEVPLRAYAPSIPKELEALVTRLLEKVPADRPESAAVVADRLEALLRQRSRASATNLVRRALADAGFPAAPVLAPRESLGRRRSRLGPMAIPYAVLFGLVVGSAAWIQASSVRTSESAGNGEPLPLVPSQAGALKVLASPWAEVFVDGQRVDVTPFARALPLAQGRHFITLRHPAAPPEERTVDIAPGETTTLDVVLRVPTEGEHAATEPPAPAPPKAP